MNQFELCDSLKKLNLKGILENYSSLAQLAQKESKSYEEYLLMLLNLELEERKLRRILRLKREAKLPLLKDLESYDYRSIKGITLAEIKKLSSGEFLKRGGNVVFYGSFGLGKTHLAIGLIQKFCELNFRCLYMTTSGLIEKLKESKKELTLSSLWKKLDRYDLIVCDELGYVPECKEGADLFFQFISQRYERRSIMITTNLTFSEWNKVFLNETTTAAAVDRIIHDCETFTLRGPSRRVEDAKKRS